MGKGTDFEVSENFSSKEFFRIKYHYLHNIIFVANTTTNIRKDVTV